MSDMTSKATVELLINGQQAQQTLNQLRQNALQLETAIAKAAATGNKADLKRLRKELTDTKRQIREVESATQQVEHVLRNLDKATPRELNKTLQNLNRQLEYIERGSEAWKAHTEKIRRVKAELKAVNDQLRDSEGFWDRFNRKMNDWQTTLMAGTAAVTGIIMAGRSAVSAYADMDAEMANVRKFTGMTAEEVATLNEEFKKIDTRTAREDLNKLAEEAGKLGKQSQEDVLGFVRAANQINVALDELGEGATLTLSKLTNIFGDEERLGTEKALLSVGSVINELSQNCTASAPYLANFAQRMAGVGAQAKMTIPEIMGLAAVLDSQGQKVEMASTAVSKVIMDMFKQQDQIIQATGLNAKKFKETVTRDTNEGLLMLLEQLHSLGNIDVLAPVFKDMGENGARAAQVIAALAGNIEMIRWEQGEANKAFQEASSVSKEYDVQNNTVQAGLDKARKRVKELAVELGEQLMPVMRHVMSSTTLILKLMSTVIGFLSRNKVEILASVAALSAFAIVTNLVAVRAKVAAAAQVLWNAAVKVGNILLPIAQVMLNGMKLALERVIWQTRGANATQLAYNKSLQALKANAAAAKTAYGLLAVAIVAATVAIVRFIKANTEAAKAQRRLQEMEEAAGKACGDEIKQVMQLKKTIEDNNVSINNRRKAISELQKIVPGYHASLSDEGKLIGHNSKLIDIYVKQLKNMAMIKEAISRQTDLEFRYKRFESSTPDNITEAFYNERMGGMDEAQAAARAGASLAGYRAWKAQMKRMDGEKEQLDSIIEQKTKANQALADQANSLNTSPTAGTGGRQVGYTPTKTTTKDYTKKEDKFQAEKDWKAKEEALNRIAYAKGEKDFVEYTNRMLEIEVMFHQKILDRTDLTGKERLESQVGYYEALKKQQENFSKVSAEKEEDDYNGKVAAVKQRYIDGEFSYKVYQEAIEQLEITHLRKMAELFVKGSKEEQDAQKKLQDKLVQNLQRHQKETEAAEKKHQDDLSKIKEKVFGDNPQERLAKYNAEMALLKEVYNKEILAAGNNAREKLRIEEAFQKARIALMEKYNISGAENRRNWLEQWNEDMVDFLQSDFGKAVSGSLEMFSSSMSSVFQQMTTIVQAELEIQTAAINKKYEREISLAEGNNYKIKKLERQKEKEIARAKNEANRKMFAMQVIQAVAQTAQNAISAYGSAAAIPVVGYVLAPIAAAMAVAAGMLQVAAIKKQQQASEAQGYATGGFTPEGAEDKPVGVVHAGEWVASQKLVKNPVTRPLLEALDYAQRTNTIGSLTATEVSQAITAPAVLAQSAVRAQQVPQKVIVQNNPSPTPDAGLTETIERLRKRLEEPFLTVNSVTGETGMKQAEEEYEKLIRNKTPKSRRT